MRAQYNVSRLTDNRRQMIVGCRNTNVCPRQNSNYFLNHKKLSNNNRFVNFSLPFARLRKTLLCCWTSFWRSSQLIVTTCRVSHRRVTKWRTRQYEPVTSVRYTVGRYRPTARALLDQVARRGGTAWRARWMPWTVSMPTYNMQWASDWAVSCCRAPARHTTIVI